MKSTYLDLQSDHSKKPADEGVLFFDVLNVIHVDPDFLSAVNSCLLPKKSQFFFWKKTMGSLDSVDSKINIFHFFISPDTLRSDFSPNLTVGIFVFFSGWKFVSNFEGVHQPGSLDLSHSERSSVTDTFPDPKTKEKKTHHLTKKTTPC